VSVIASKKCLENLQLRAALRVFCLRTVRSRMASGLMAVRAPPGRACGSERNGLDQCDSTPGRSKDDGNGGCYFDEADSGPHQCTPPLPTEPNGGPGDGSLQVAALEAPVSGGDERARRGEQNPHVPPDRSIARDNR